jgi:hypothetical protein
LESSVPRSFGSIEEQILPAQSRRERFAASVETEKAQGTWTDPARGKVTVADWTGIWLKSKVDLRPTAELVSKVCFGLTSSPNSVVIR